MLINGGWATIRRFLLPMIVIPAKAGTHLSTVAMVDRWVPAFAGMTRLELNGAMKQFAVYMVASGRNGTLYIGMTSNLPQRIWQHKNKVVPGFTARYGCDRLVWFQPFDDAKGAILREKQMKEWKRAWKIALIEKDNPSWNDLFESL